MSQTNQQSDAARQADIAKRAHQMFDSFSTEVKARIVFDKLQGDFTEADMLEAALERARKNLAELDRLLAKRLLSSSHVDELEKQLTDKVIEADALLEDMRQLRKVLDTVKAAADLVGSVLGIVKSITAIP